jgi:transcriptional regulator with XRE-family HTH domain
MPRSLTRRSRVARRRAVKGGASSGVTNRGPQKRLGRQGRCRVTGRELKGIRRRLGYTQQEMADALGISLSYYVVLERGRRRISDDLGTRALSVRREPAEWKWFDYGYDVGRDLAGGLPRGYERRVRPTAMRLGAEQAFQRWLHLKHRGPVAEDAQQEFQKGFEAGWEEMQRRGVKRDGRS